MWSRRSILCGATAAGLSPALGACSPLPDATAPELPDVPFKELAPYPLGTSAISVQLDDPQWHRLAQTHFSQITPEWQMKMEYILFEGGYRFDAPDRIAAYARAHGMGLHGHTLIWYAQGKDTFGNLSASDMRVQFDRYIAAVAGRYAGQMRGWDVVNEPVAEDGNGLRSHHWSQGLGHIDYMVRAFEQAKLADPDAILFLNEYNLENNPAKGTTFLRLIEQLLKAGVPVGGIGCQSHLDIEIPEGQISRFIREAAQFGLPIHISELDASRTREGGPPDVRTVSKKISQQIDRVKELADSFNALPKEQQYGLTLWGLRDTDSWLRRPPHDDGKDSPVAFGADGQPNAVGRTLARSWL